MGKRPENRVDKIVSDLLRGRRLRLRGVDADEKEAITAAARLVAAGQGVDRNAAIGEGVQVLEKALPSLPAKTDSGVVVAAGPNGLMEAFLKAMTGHRHFERVIEGVSDGFSSFAKLGAGYFTDRLRNRKPLAVFGYALTALSTASFAFATHAYHVLIGRTVAWLGRGVRSPVLPLGPGRRPVGPHRLFL